MDLRQAVEFYTTSSYSLNAALETGVVDCNIDMQVLTTIESNMKPYSGFLYTGLAGFPLSTPTFKFSRLISCSKSWSVAESYAMWDCSRKGLDVATVMAFNVKDLLGIDCVDMSKHPEDREVIIQRNCIFNTAIRNSYYRKDADKETKINILYGTLHAA